MLFRCAARALCLSPQASSPSNYPNICVGCERGHHNECGINFLQQDGTSVIVTMGCLSAEAKLRVLHCNGAPTMCMLCVEESGSSANGYGDNIDATKAADSQDVDTSKSNDESTPPTCTDKDQPMQLTSPNPAEVSQDNDGTSSSHRSSDTEPLAVSVQTPNIGAPSLIQGNNVNTNNDNIDSHTNNDSANTATTQQETSNNKQYVPLQVPDDYNLDEESKYYATRFYEALDALYAEKRRKTPTYTPKVPTKEFYDYIATTLKNWKVGQKRSRPDSRLNSKYVIAPGSKYTQVRIRDKDNSAGAKLATREGMFIIIHKCHQDLMHPRTPRTHKTKIDHDWYGITEEEIKLYTDRCPICLASRTLATEKQRPLKMILDDTIGKRAQMDLIDMTSQPDPAGYKWILRLIDHLSGHGHVRPLYNKTAEECGKAIIQILSSAVEFDILQSDNGGEFLGKTVEYVNRHFPDTHLIKGRSRHPQSQGGIERGNGPFEEAVQKGMQINKTMSWGDMVIYVVQNGINKRPSRAKANYSPYEAMYGKVSKNSPLQLLTSEVYDECATEGGLAAALDLLKINGDATDDEIRSAIRAGDSKFDEHPSLPALPVDALVPLPSHHTPASSANVLSNHPTGGEVVDMDVDDDQNPDDAPEVIVLLDAFESKVRYDLAIQHKQSAGVSRNSCRSTRGQEAADLVTKAGRDKLVKTIMTSAQTYDFVYPRLKCDECCFAGSHLISIGDTKYMDDCKSTNRWYDSDFLSSFAALVAHDYHVRGRTQYGDDFVPKIQLIHCNYPKAVPAAEECRDLKPTTEKVVSILHGVGHFCVMDFEVASRRVTIYDGLNYDLHTWTEHIAHVLQRCNLTLRGEPMSTSYTTALRDEMHLMIGVVYDYEVDWVIQKSTFVPQNNSYDCGPIACFKVMQSYDKYNHDQDPIDMGNIRTFVVDSYLSFLQRHAEELHISAPTALSQSNAPTSNVDCAICHSVAIGHPMTTMVCCNKQLHAVCVAQWLSEHPNCIFCRAHVESISVEGAVIPFEAKSATTSIMNTVSKYMSSVQEKREKGIVIDGTKVHKSDAINAETAVIRAQIRAAQEKQANQVNNRRKKTLYVDVLGVGDICNIRVEGNVRASTDLQCVPVMVTQVIQSPAGRSVSYQVASKHGYLKEKLRRERLDHFPWMNAKVMNINTDVEGFRSNLEIHQASALFNVNGGGGSCGCKKVDCSTSSRCKCKLREGFCTSKCHGGRGSVNHLCKLCPPPPVGPPPPVAENVCHPAIL